MAATNLELLSEAQIDCLRLALQQKSSVEIGKTLNLSSVTVEHLLSVALEQLGVSSLHDAARVLASDTLTPADPAARAPGPFAAALQKPALREIAPVISWRVRLIWLLMIALGSALGFGLLLGLLSLLGVGITPR